MKKIAMGMFIVVMGCTSGGNTPEPSLDASWMHAAQEKLTDIIVHDIFSPPVASRVYAYAHIACYETLAADPASGLASMSGVLKDFRVSPSIKLSSSVQYQLASFVAMQTVAAELVFSVNEWNAFCETQLDSIYGKHDENYKERYADAIRYGKQVAQDILQWASDDLYRQSRSFPKYTVSSDPNEWQPTPPGYMDAIEPNWGKIRPMLLDSANQFEPAPALSFSKEKESEFYKYANEVYKTELDSAKIEIANFWDCNPFAVKFNGHLTYAAKKISPGGHWLGITGIVCRDKSASIYETSRAYTWVAITLFDGFIGCWHQKFKSRLIRPETYINRYIDPDWKPILQTPPFPEYTSGHSVVSAASSEVLSYLFSDSVRYVDDTEVQFGLKPRSYKSFRDAAQEAAISRIYGGIHYRPAIQQGFRQGSQIGIWTVDKLGVKK